MKFTTLTLAILATITGVTSAPIPPSPFKPGRKIPPGFDMDIHPQQGDWDDAEVHENILKGGCWFKCFRDASRYGRDIRECYYCDDAPAAARRVADAALANPQPNAKGPFTDPSWPAFDKGPFHGVGR